MQGESIPFISVHLCYFVFTNFVFFNNFLIYDHFLKHLKDHLKILPDMI